MENEFIFEEHFDSLINCYAPADETVKELNSKLTEFQENLKTFRNNFPKVDNKYRKLYGPLEHISMLAGNFCSNFNINMSYIVEYEFITKQDETLINDVRKSILLFTGDKTDDKRNSRSKCIEEFRKFPEVLRILDSAKEKATQKLEELIYTAKQYEELNEKLSEFSNNIKKIYDKIKPDKLGYYGSDLTDLILKLSNPNINSSDITACINDTHLICNSQIITVESRKSIISIIISLERYRNHNTNITIKEYEEAFEKLPEIVAILDSAVNKLLDADGKGLEFTNNLIKINKAYENKKLNKQDSISLCKELIEVIKKRPKSSFFSKSSSYLKDISKHAEKLSKGLSSGAFKEKDFYDLLKSIDTAVTKGKQMKNEAKRKKGHPPILSYTSVQGTLRKIAKTVKGTKDILFKES